MVAAPPTPAEDARRLFAPLGPTYDRYARLLSFGQDPRWRSFLVSRLEVEPGNAVLDVATGTGAVALELVRAHGVQVVGVDQSAQMLAVARARIARAGLEEQVRLVHGRAEELPFEDASFDGLTFTYLLRYVDDPAATLRELARVVRPGGIVVSLEFGVPPRPLWRSLWELYVRAGLPVLGRAISPEWQAVGSYLGPSIRGFYARHPLGWILEAWGDAGITEIRFCRLSLGGGLVIWGKRA
ncbi:MAG: ubiquinone/menaquinone biosynthesis methyltransferase [Actinobacteria bacterium]|nr:ubiquinone/menaquinone biosynthesis methyltransferase [Actinomycetota bacterium]